MVEMSETATILNNITDRSLVVLDEIGRGTSTYDGISIAWSVAEFLLTEKGRKPKTLFATHYHELTELEGKVAGACNYQVAVQEEADGIIFLHKIIRGKAGKSYAIHVARLAGLPKRCLKKATIILKELEAKKQQEVGGSAEQLRLFQEQETFWVQQLASININELSPIEAHQKLHEMQRKSQLIS